MKNGAKEEISIQKYTYKRQFDALERLFYNFNAGNQIFYLVLLLFLGNVRCSIASNPKVIDEMLCFWIKTLL